MSRYGILQFITFFLYVLIQVMLLKNLVLFDTAFCMVYVAFILLLPVETNTQLLIIIGFILGFTIDVFYDSLGIHSFAVVFVAWLRNYWLTTITPQGGYEAGSIPSLTGNDLQWFLVYSFPLILLHHLLVFFIEVGGFGLFWFTLLKVGSSLLFTMTILLLLQYLSIERRRS